MKTSINGIHDDLLLSSKLRIEAALCYGNACDAADKKNSIGFLREVFRKTLHSYKDAFKLETTILIKVITGKDVGGDNIKELWDNHIPKDYKSLFDNVSLDKTVTLLNGPHLFGTELSIQRDNIEIILAIINRMHQIILELIDIKNKN